MSSVRRRVRAEHTHLERMSISQPAWILTLSAWCSSVVVVVDVSEVGVGKQKMNAFPPSSIYFLWLSPWTPVQIPHSAMHSSPRRRKSKEKVAWSLLAVYPQIKVSTNSSSSAAASALSQVQTHFLPLHLSPCSSPSISLLTFRPAPWASKKEQGELFLRRLLTLLNQCQVLGMFLPPEAADKSCRPWKAWEKVVGRWWV